jgi:hypothetical protein
MLAITVVLVAIAGAAVPGAVVEGPAPATPTADGVVAYYFHGNVRCATCRKIEAYTDEAVAGGFPDELESGAVSWQVVNVDVDANKHFIEDFQLVTRSVVLAQYRDGKVVRWQNLGKVWQLVRDEERFIDYVQSELNGFLGEG